MTSIDPQVTPMCWQFFHLEDNKLMDGKNLLYRNKRKIGEVFVINCIKLVLLHEAHKVREFHCYDSLRFQNYFQAFDKVVQGGDMSQHVIAYEEISFFPSATNSCAVLSPKNFTMVGIPFF